MEMQADSGSDGPPRPLRCVQSADFTPMRACPLVHVCPAEDGGCTTVYSCFQRGVRLFPGNRCMGTRVWVTEEQKDAADAPKYKLEDKAPMRAEYVWETYAEIDEAARDFGAGLVAMGYPHHTNVGIFSANRVEWMVGALGLYSQNMRVVSLYPSLGENAVEFIINHVTSHHMLRIVGATAAVATLALAVASRPGRRG